MVTVVTKTIGPSGRDYTTFTLAEAAVESIATAEFGSTDLVANDGAIVFEADAATYSESVNFSSSLTTDATRQVTYKPAAGSEHGGVAGAGVRIQFGNLAISSVCVSVGDPFTALNGLELDWTDTSGTGRACDINWTAKGAAFRGLIVRHAGTGVLVQCTNTRTTVSTDFPITFENSVLRGSGNGFRVWNYGASEKAFTVSNCTIECAFRAFDIYSNTDDTTYTVTNNLILSASEDFRDQGGGGTSTVLGSNNFGPQTSATHVFPAALKGSPYPITATTSFSTPLGAGDYAVYMGATGALANVTGNDVWQQGVGPGTNSDVPTTDINGVARSGASCNPGAFEADGFVAPTITTQTIGPVGRDFATFTLAEASLPAEDITFTNRAFVFEADAATYTGFLNPNSSLVTDETRTVTYRPAAGSEHGGVTGAGVVIDTGASNRPLTIQDNFTVVDGFNLTTTTTYCAWIQGAGAVVRNIIASASSRGFLVYGGTATDPIKVHNCVSRGNSSISFYLLADTSSDAYGEFINCTGDSTGTYPFLNQQTANTASGTFINCLSLSAQAFFNAGGTASGSNNFGGSSNPFPAALQGSPYPITPSTDPLASGADLAIYDEATGQLYDLPENAVWQAGAGTSTPGVPKLDILGVVRATGTANPGAFEAAVAVAAAATSSFDNNSALHAQLLETQAPWIWLYELQTRDDPPQRYRLTSFTKSVRFGLNGSGQPLVYSPAPITHGNVEEGTDGSLPTISVTLGNAGPIIGAAMDAADGFVGLPVRIMLVSSLDIASGKPAVSQEGEVVSAAIKTEAVVLQISAFNLYQLQFPPFIHSRRRCRWIFGSAECGYNTQIASAGFSICNKTQANCEERGDDEVAQGFARQHPARFGAFPGIPRAGR